MDNNLLIVTVVVALGLLGALVDYALKRARPELFGQLSRAGQMFYKNELFAFEYWFTPSDQLNRNVSRALHRIYDNGLFEGALVADQVSRREQFLAAVMAAIIVTNEPDETPFYKTEMRIEEAIGAMRIAQTGEARKARQHRIAIVENTFHKKR